jgi:hypothetical protein
LTEAFQKRFGTKLDEDALNEFHQIVLGATDDMARCLLF